MLSRLLAYTRWWALKIVFSACLSLLCVRFVLPAQNGTVLNQPTTARPFHAPLLSQWFIDWRNADAAAYFTEVIVNSTSLPGVDATFTDDLPGVPAEHPDVQNITGMSDTELSHLQFATQQAENEVGHLALHSDLHMHVRERWSSNISAYFPVNVPGCRCFGSRRKILLGLRWWRSWSGRERLFNESGSTAIRVFEPCTIMSHSCSPITGALSLHAGPTTKQHSWLRGMDEPLLRA